MVRCHLQLLQEKFIFQKKRAEKQFLHEYLVTGEFSIKVFSPCYSFPLSWQFCSGRCYLCCPKGISLSVLVMYTATEISVTAFQPAEDLQITVWVLKTDGAWRWFGRLVRKACLHSCSWLGGLLSKSPSPLPFPGRRSTWWRVWLFKSLLLQEWKASLSCYLGAYWCFQAFFIPGIYKSGFLVQGGSVALISSLASFGADSPQFYIILYFILCMFLCCKKGMLMFCYVWSFHVSLHKTWQFLEVNSMLVGRRSLIWSKPCAEVCLQVN